MKKLSLFLVNCLLCVILVLPVISCSKENAGSGSGSENKCYTCVSTSITTSSSGATIGEPVVVTQTVCGITDINALEKSGTYNVTSGLLTQSTVMKCTQQ
jgi:hypothetical protein